MKLSKIIKNYRSRKSLTLEQLHVRSKLSKGFLSRLEKGDYDKKNISLASIIRLSTGLNVRAKEILDDLSVIEQDEPLSLNVYMREKYKIKSQKKIKLIEDIINNLKEKRL